MDYKQFATLLAPIVATYDRFDASKAKMQVFYKILGDLPEAVLEAAVLDYLSESKWPPTPADLRRQAFGLLDEGQGDAYDGWNAAMKAVRSPYGGRYASMPRFKDPLVARTIERIGGWINFCAGEGDFTSNRARFIEAYRALKDREQRQMRMLPEIRETAKMLSADRKLLLPGGE